MEKCRRMKRLQCMSKNWIYSWQWNSSRTHQQYCRSESFAMKTDILMNGSTVKNHISFKTGFGYNATRRTSSLSWFQVFQRVQPLVPIIQLQWHLQDRRGILLHLLQARLLHQRQQHQVKGRLEKERIELKVIPLQCLCQVSMLMIERWNPLSAVNPITSQFAKPTTNYQKTNKMETMIERWHPLSADSGRASSEIPEWLQEFREILVDDEVPEHRDSHASSSHEVSLEPTSKRREDFGKHSVYTLFPGNRNCEICKRTRITRAPCRRRNGGAVPRAENFGDLITADHKVLSDNCESRNNHRCAVVVQDLATQWIQAYPCKTRTSQETQRSLQKFLEPDRKPKVIYTDNSLEFSWRRSGTENTHLDTATTNSRRKSHWFSWRIRRVSSTTSRLVSGCRWSDKWLLVHVRKLHLPPSRWTQSQTLLAERRIIPNSSEVHWCIQNYSYEFGCQERETHRWLLEYRWVKRLVWSMDMFHSIYSIGRKTSRRIYVVRVQMNEKTADIQARSFMARTLGENWERNAKLKEKQKWSNEKLHLENARKLRGIYFIDLEDKEFKETIKNARKKLETPVAPAMPCKIIKKNCGSGAPNKIKTRLACILEAGESTRLRMGESLPIHHEDNVQGKGNNSLQQKKLVHKYIPLPQAVQIPAAKAAVDKECEILEKIFGVEPDESQK